MTEKYLMDKIKLFTTRARVTLVEDHLGCLDLYIQCNKRSVEIVKRDIVPEIPAPIVVHVWALKWYECWKENYQFNWGKFYGM